VNPIATIANAQRRQAVERFFVPPTAPTYEGDVVANTRNPETHAWHRTAGHRPRSARPAARRRPTGP